MERVLHMVGGEEEEASYAKNSSHQRQVLMDVKPILMKCIEKLLEDMESDDHLPNFIRVSDLGCSSGPNLFLTAEHIVEAIDKASHMIRKREIQYFLNDLVSNDFNLVFKGLHEFYQKTAKFRSTCLIAAMPGSFYGKLFPDRSMHFFHSSYCLQWLSQVPKGLVIMIPKNKLKASIYCANTSPPEVHEAYLSQFSQDFSLFLRMRSEELVKHGQMLLTFICKDDEEVEGSHFWFLLGMALNEMVAEGHLTGEKLDSFNLPWYAPSIDESRKMVEDEGSFEIQQMHTFKTRLDACCSDFGTVAVAGNRARYVATYLRAVSQPVLENHFGEDLCMDILFERFANKLVYVLQLGLGFLNTLVISLRKKN